MIAWLLLLTVGEPTSVATCLEASEVAQRAEHDGRFLEARTGYLTCVEAGCPAVVRRDCEARLIAVRGLVPSLVVVVVDHEGRDIVDADVTIDGTTTPANGGLVELETGRHDIVIRARGQQHTRNVVLRSGVRARPIRFALDRPLTTNTASVVIVAPVVDTGANVPAIVSTVVSGVALTGFAIFGVIGVQRYNDVEASPCGRSATCSREETQSARQMLLAADVALGVGIASALAAAAFWLWPSDKDAAGVGVAVGPAGAVVVGRF